MLRYNAESTIYRYFCIWKVVEYKYSRWIGLVCFSENGKNLDHFYRDEEKKPEKKNTCKRRLRSHQYVNE